MVTEIILLILEIVGTVAFAVSGALVAIKARFDIFGVLVVGCITAVGGGITRDLIVGQTPPLIFSNLYILGIAAATSVGVFFIAYARRKTFEGIRERIERVNNYFDAAGLAAFTVMGVELAFSAYFIQENAFLSITLGVLTGVGGGLLRDILTETTPYIFKKHVYALASILGAIVYYLLRLVMENIVLPTLVGLALVFLLRVLATRYRWSLPKVQLENVEEKEKGV